MNAKFWFLLTSFLLPVNFTARAGLFERQSDAAQTSLMELYTSEGCSSCPPAERWLSNLKKDPGLWRDFVPVSFHVDYWDGLGWQDRFGKKEFTDRQYEYVKDWGATSVYTPGFVLNGKEWTAWRSSLPLRPNTTPGVLRATETSPGVFAISFSPSDGRAEKWTFHVAVLGFDLSSKVHAGENSGRNLTHDFVALSLEQRAAAANEANFKVQRPQGPGISRLALAIWVTRAGNEIPVQALGGWWQPSAESESKK